MRSRSPSRGHNTNTRDSYSYLTKIPKLRYPRRLPPSFPRGGICPSPNLWAPTAFIHRANGRIRMRRRRRCCQYNNKKRTFQGKCRKVNYKVLVLRHAIRLAIWLSGHFSDAELINQTKLRRRLQRKAHSTDSSGLVPVHPPVSRFLLSFL